MGLGLRKGRFGADPCKKCMAVSINLGSSFGVIT